MTNVYSDKQLKESLLSEKIHNNTVYYTLVQKAQKNWTCFTNWRLLILDTEHRVLYYLKEYPPLPLGDAPYEPNK